MSTAKTHAIYGFIGSAVWLVAGNVIQFASISSWYEILERLSLARQLGYAAPFLLLGVLTALVQSTLMAQGAKRRSPLLIAGVPMMLGAAVGVLVAVAGPLVIASQVASITLASSLFARAVIGTLLGIVAVFATTALAAWLRSQLGMREPISARMMR